MAVVGSGRCRCVRQRSMSCRIVIGGRGQDMAVVGSGQCCCVRQQLMSCRIVIGGRGQGGDMAVVNVIV